MIEWMFRPGRFVTLLLVFTAFAHAQREFRSATRFDPPPESFHAPDSLRVLEDQLKRDQFVEAATQIESLLRDNADAITPTDERGLMSVRNWLELAACLYPK